MYIYIYIYIYITYSTLISRRDAAATNVCVFWIYSGAKHIICVCTRTYIFWQVYVCIHNMCVYIKVHTYFDKCMYKWEILLELTVGPVHLDRLGFGNQQRMPDNWLLHVRKHVRLAEHWCGSVGSPTHTCLISRRHLSCGQFAVAWINHLLSQQVKCSPLRGLIRWNKVLRQARDLPCRMLSVPQDLVGPALLGRVTVVPPRPPVFAFAMSCMRIYTLATALVPLHRAPLRRIHTYTQGQYTMAWLTWLYVRHD
jgi:hypothetical protein